MTTAEQDVTRLTEAFQALARATVLDPTDADPGAALLTPEGDVDWSLLAVYVQSVLEGSPSEHALEDVVDARSGPSRDHAYLQRHPDDLPQ